MKYSTELYAKAFLEVWEGVDGKDKSKITKRFLEVIGKNGDLGNFSKIEGAIRRALVKKNGGRFIEAEVARPANEVARRKISESFSKKDYVQMHVRPEILAGARILIDGEREFDFSFERRIRKLFS